MDTNFIRFGVSQRLGRFKITVQAATEQTASIEVALDNDVLIVYFVTLETSQAFSGHFDTWQEWAARIALAQAARMEGAGTRPTSRSEILDHWIAPWMGDLLLDRYGGATIGVHIQLEEKIKRMRAANQKFSKSGMPTPYLREVLGSMPRARKPGRLLSAPESKERRAANGDGRRKNADQCGLIERGIQLQRSAGDTAAVAFLLGHRIPQYIVLRVLSCSSFRRNPTRPLSRRAQQPRA